MLTVDALHATYGGPDVLTDVGLDVGPGEILALLGPSGSGKSTLLRCVAGLHPPRAGRITLDGQDVTHLPAEQRGVGLVFQDHALFPHRDVAGNVAFGPRMQGLDHSETAARVQAALEAVGLGALAHRRIDELSGGEQQRVALARAAAARPRLLLLDEPYGSLDRPLRERLLGELPALVRTLTASAVLVTHDQTEALAVADRIAVLIDGRVRAVGTATRLWSDPGDRAVAEFLGVGPMLSGSVHAGAFTAASGLTEVVSAPGLPDGPAHLLLPSLHLEVFAPDAPAASATDLQVGAEVLAVRPAGDHHRLLVRLGGVDTPLTLRRPGPVGPVAPGATVWLRLPRTAVRVLPDGTSGPDAPARRPSGSDRPGRPDRSDQ